MEKILVTGGAGFIGSHLVDALMAQGNEVVVFDNLSSGSVENIIHWWGNPNFKFIKGDLLNPVDLAKLEIESYSLVFHLAANPEVRVGSENPDAHFKQNVVSTYNLLELIRRADNRPTLVFMSTSTVYGEAAKVPTPEDYAPLKPISIYGASKLAGEALVTAYAYTYGFKAVIYRIANVVGPRSRHGVVYDFVQKLKKNRNELEILGDGTQKKSYLYVSDCIRAMLLGIEKSDEQVEIYNIGSEDQIDVKTIANIVVEEMGLKDVKLIFRSGTADGRGWIGDIKNMQLDISKIKKLGWEPKLNSEQAIRETVNTIIKC